MCQVSELCVVLCSGWVSEWVSEEDKGEAHGRRCLTRMSRQADFSRVIWSAMVRVVKPGSRLANSTILMMHLVESSLNLSHKPRSSWTRWSELEFWDTHTHKSVCRHSGGVQPCLHQERACPSLTTHLHFTSIKREKNPFTCCINHWGHTDGLMGNWIS